MTDDEIKANIWIELKIWPEYFDDVANGVKRFELRKNDRDFAVGKRLLQREWSPSTESYSGRWVRCVVTHMIDDAARFGLMPGYCIMSISTISAGDHTINETPQLSGGAKI